MEGKSSSNFIIVTEFENTYCLHYHRLGLEVGAVALSNLVVDHFTRYLWKTAPLGMAAHCLGNGQSALYYSHVS